MVMRPCMLENSIFRSYPAISVHFLPILPGRPLGGWRLVRGCASRRFRKTIDFPIDFYHFLSFSPSDALEYG